MAEKSIKENSDLKDKRKFSFKFVIAGIVILLIVGGGYLSGFVLNAKRFGKNSSGRSSAESGSADSKNKISVTHKDIISPEDVKLENKTDAVQFFPMDSFTVNLSGSGGKRSLNTKFELEFSGKQTEEELTKKVPQMRDVMLLYLSSKTVEEVQCIEGKIALKNELIMRINRILKTGVVKNLYFTEFIIQ